MKIFTYFFLFLFLISSVLAIGVSPPGYKVDYDGAKTYKFDMKIINSGQTDSFITIDSYGGLEEYVSLSEYQFQFLPGERFHEITVYVDLPAYNELTVFDKQKVNLYIQEGKPDAIGEMSFRTSVTAKIVIDIPIPGKYGEIGRFEMIDTNKGYGAPISLELKNKGTEKLSGVSAQVTVADHLGTQLDVMDFSNIDIDASTSYTIKDIFPTQSYDSSKYFATATFTYDPQKASLSKTYAFFVGSTDVALFNYTPELVKGKINKVALNLQSLWGSPLKNIRGTISYMGKTQALPVIDFNEFEQKTVEVFLDVPLTEETLIDASLTLDIPVDENTDAQKVIPLEFEIVEASKPKLEFPFGNSSILVMSLLIAALLLIGIYVFILIKRKNDKKNKEY